MRSELALCRWPQLVSAWGKLKLTFLFQEMRAFCMLKSEFVFFNYNLCQSLISEALARHQINQEIGMFVRLWESYCMNMEAYLCFFGLSFVYWTCTQMDLEEGRFHEQDSRVSAGTTWESSKQDTRAMRHHAFTNKNPTVILASVALAWLTVYANRKSVKDHRNPNSLRNFHYHFLLGNKGSRGQRRHTTFWSKKKKITFWTLIIQSTHSCSDHVPFSWCLPEVSDNVSSYKSSVSHIWSIASVVTIWPVKSLGV